MENRFPKNVRQIGNVSDTPKIYVEDYVDTFLNHICEKTDEDPAGAFLIGHTVKQEDQECVYISGAVRMEEIQTDGQDVVISEETWAKASEDRQEYFGDVGFIGWFLSIPGRPLVLNKNLIKIHEENFASPNTVLILGDAREQEEAFFAYKYKELMEMSGHYIYYEKNKPMQNYMVSTRKQNCVSPSEAVEDYAAKEFRSLVRERFELKEQKHSSRMMYVASVLLVLIVLIIGVTTVNNYDKMRSVQSSLDYIKNSVSKNDNNEETVAASGTAIAQTDSEDKKENSEEAKTAADGQAEEEADSEKGQADEQPGSTQSSDSNQPADTSKDASEEDTEKNVSTMQEMSEDIYIVKKGDTLAKISKQMYGDISHVDAICRMNGLSDGNLIFIGQKLLLP